MDNQANFSNFLVAVCAGLIIFFLTLMLAQMLSISSKIDSQTESINERIDHTNERVDHTNERVDHTNERVDSVIIRAE